MFSRKVAGPFCSWGDKTFEDPTIVDPAERLKAFGLEDHVRQYGRDYADRLRETGFQVQTTYVSDMYSPQETLRMGLNGDAGEIYYCTKE